LEFLSDCLSWGTLLVRYRRGVLLLSSGGVFFWFTTVCVVMSEEMVLVRYRIGS